MKKIQLTFLTTFFVCLLQNKDGIRLSAHV